MESDLRKWMRLVEDAPDKNANTPQQEFLAQAPEVIDGAEAEWGTGYWCEEGQCQPDEVVLKQLVAITRGQGAGSRLLSQACALADKLGVTIWAELAPAERGVANKHRLLKFYRRFGFDLYDDDAALALNTPNEWPQIVRRPR